METRSARTFLAGFHGKFLPEGRLPGRGVPFIIEDDGPSVDFDRILDDERRFPHLGARRASILYNDLRTMSEQRALFANYERTIDKAWNHAWFVLSALVRESRFAPSGSARIQAGARPIDFKSRLLLPEQHAVYADSTTYRGYALEHAFAGLVIPGNDASCLPFRKMCVKRPSERRIANPALEKMEPRAIFVLDADAMLKKPLRGTATDELSRYLKHLDMDTNWFNATVKSADGNPIPRFGQEADETVEKLREAHALALARQRERMR